MDADPPAFADDCVAAFEAHFDFVRRVMRRLGVRAPDLDDLMQEVFIALWRGWAQVDRTRPIRPWLWGISFRVARNHLRRRWREIPDDDIEIEDPGLAVEGGLAAAQARSLVRSALARMPEKYCRPLVMHELDGLSVNDVAALLAMPVATAYTRVRRGREAFARAVAEVSGERVGSQRTRAFLSPTALLALERAAPRVSEAVRRAAVARARSAMLLPLPPASASSAAAPLALGGVAVVVAAAAAVLALWASLPSAGVARAAGAVRGPAAEPSVVSGHHDPINASTAAVPRFAVGRAAAVPDQELVEPLQDGLTGYWRFDDGPQATVVTDQSGHGRDCTLRVRRKGVPVAWVPGKFGAALDLAGNAWLDCPQPDSSTDRPVAITVSAWIKLRAFPLVHAAVATRQIGSAHLDHFFVGFSGDQLRVGSQAWNLFIIQRAPLSLNRWYHLAFSHDEEGMIRVYLDGDEVTHERGGQVDLGRVTAGLTLGAGHMSHNRTVARQHLEGAMDEVRVYARALTPRQISALARGAGATP